MLLRSDIDIDAVPWDESEDNACESMGATEAAILKLRKTDGSIGSLLSSFVVRIPD